MILCFERNQQVNVLLSSRSYLVCIGKGFAYKLRLLVSPQARGYPIQMIVHPCEIIAGYFDFNHIAELLSETRIQQKTLVTQGLPDQKEPLFSIELTQELD